MHASFSTWSVRGLVFGSLFSVLLFPITSHAAFRYVAGSPLGDDAPHGVDNDCSKKKSPCLTIKHAVSHAQPNDTISIAQPPAGWYLEKNIRVDKDLTFVGAGSPRVRIQAWEPGGPGRHFFIVDANAYVRISNLELTGGYATDGGSISNRGRLTLLNCRVADSVAANRGGGIYNDGGTLVISDSDIDNNITDYGGAIYNGEGGDLVVTNTSTITNNGASDSGGAIYAEASSITAIQGESSVSSNSANINGGAIYVEDNSHLSIFSGSNLEANFSTFDGGAVFNNGGTVTISSAAFRSNSTHHNGGAVFNNGGTVSFLDSVFLFNSADDSGGMISNVGGGRLTVENTVADYNRATQGGAIFNDPQGTSTTTVRESTFVSNTATQGGGAICNTGGTLRVEFSTFLTNSATNGGGAIANANDGRFSVSQSTFGSNTANRGGAIFDATTASPTIATGVFSSTFVTNSAWEAGGAIYYDPRDGYLSISNSTFSENDATNTGGAIANDLAGIGTIAIANATFYGNAAADGASIYNRQGFHLDNSIITHSVNVITGALTDACSLGGIALGGTNNLIGTFPSTDLSCNSSAVFNKGTVSGFDVDLKDNGGPTETHALDPASTAIDAGFGNCPGTVLGTLLTTDQRGVARPQGAACDIGAIEQQ
jgi:predicted outer membrane repeat protein